MTSTHIDVEEKEPMLPGVHGSSNVHYGSLGLPICQSLEEGAQQETLGSTISFHNINYVVQVKQSMCSAPVPKTVLTDVSGIFKPGMNAILGPTGSGKTSLLDVIAARKDPNGLEGYVLIDGNLQPENFQLMAGYVVQDDVVMGTLTVRENFQFSAALRLPQSTSKEERERRVDQIIKELGLTGCADTKVGTEFIRGVSGGERKRCNIGMELIIQPSILFLDEPTTGLDASTANSVMRLLKKLGDGGRTIVFSIHQPRFSIYRLFDNLMLLSQGQCVYHGPAMEAVDYFKTVGFVCEQYNNPPDFFLDVINGDTNGGRDEGQNGTVLGITSQDSNENPDQLTDYLVQSFVKSVWNRKVVEQLEPIQQQFANHVEQGTMQVRSIKYQTSFLRQLAVVSKRAVLNIIRNPMTSIMQVIILAIFAAIVGGIYWQVDNSAQSGIQNRVGAFFFIVMNMVFANLSAVELFLKERIVFIHENSNGFYRTSAYFLAKVFCDLIPLRGIPIFVFSAITYWMIGFQAEAGKFFFYVLNLILTALSACGIAFAISASVRILAIANLLLSMAYVFMMIFSGLLVNLDSIGDWIKWIKYISLFRYSLDALSINELKDQPFCQSTNGTECQDAGNEYLDSQGIKYQDTFDLWLNEIVLAGMTVFFMLLAYIQLRRIKKLK